MAIGSYLSAIRNFTVDTTSTVYTFSKDAIARGCSACSSLALRVTQIAARAIPNAVSNAVKAHPKRSYFAAGVIVSGVIIGTIAYRALSNHKKATEEDRTKLLNDLRATLSGNDPINTSVALIDGLSKRAS